MQPTPPPEGLQQSVSLALLESNFGDLEELANDIEGISSYTIRPDHLSSWAHKIRAALNIMRVAANNVGPDAVLKANHSVRLPFQGDKTETGSASSGDPVTTLAPPVPLVHPGVVAPYASGALHVLLDALVQMTKADWGTCFVYTAKTEELVLACSVGHRLDRPGTLRLSATSGIESHVLTTGIAVNVAHAYAEQDFSEAQDKKATTRTRSELVFPLMKPGSTVHTFGVIQLCNKSRGTGFFDEADESITAQCAPFLAAIVAKFPGDITNPQCFDPALLSSVAPLPKEAPRGYPLPADAKDAAPARLVFRTARAGHLRRAEVMRDAGRLPAVPSISEALAHISHVHDAWRNAVALNMELERELSRLQETLSVSKREQQRLQANSGELKRQLESTASALEQLRLRRQNSLP